MKPAIGRIVHFALETGASAINGQRVFAAVITAVFSDERVSLTVFTDATWGGADEWLLRRTSIMKSESGNPEDGCWHWPPRD